MNRKIVIFFVFVLVVAFSGVFYFFARPYEKKEYKEVEEVASLPELNFQTLSIYFTDLAEQKGGAYAFEVLRRIEVPPDIDMHLLGHIVGDELFKQKGAEGIQVCTQDFRNACSHSIVVGLFLEKGDVALPEIAKACRDAPGGKGAYTMCFHGLGHGVLAYVGYDFPKAIELCKKTGTPEYRNREYAECVGGAVMELIGGGFHDQELWAEMRPRFLVPNDPLSLCGAGMVPDNEAREVCYVYLTPYLFEITASDRAHPADEELAKAFLYCDAIPLQERIFRDACYRGFGKEFVGLVLERDIRVGAIEHITDDQLSQIYDWCLLADNREGAAACLLHAMDSLFWGGENNSAISIKFCMLMNNEYYQQSCMRHLIQTARYYFDDAEQKKYFCNRVPEEYQAECKQ